MKGPFPVEECELRVFHPGRALYWNDYAEAWLKPPLGALLDYGCGQCGFLKRVAGRCDAAWGVDVDPDLFPPPEELPQAKLRAIAPGGPLPFPDQAFDTIVILDVIEHVADERAVLCELARVLKSGGRLLLTTPHRGLLTFIDPANAKFIAPRLHRFVHVNILRRREYYERHFGANRRQAKGMVGDFTLDQEPWHRHYRFRELAAKAPPELAVEAWAVYFPAMRALWALSSALQVASLGWLPNSAERFGFLKRRLSRWRTRCGDQLVVMFRKCAQA